MEKVEKEERINEIKGLLRAFCKEHLNDELMDYSLKLCEKLGRKRTFDITRGKKEIIATAIVFVIARLNFLFDPDYDYFISADTISDFFGTKKSTAGIKATLIENICNIRIGEDDFCMPHIADFFTFYEIRGGLIISKEMLMDGTSRIEDSDIKREVKMDHFTAMGETIRRLMKVKSGKGKIHPPKDQRPARGGKFHEAWESRKTGKKKEVGKFGEKVKDDKKKGKKVGDRQTGLFDD